MHLSQNELCTRKTELALEVEILSRLSPSYTTMATSADQRKQRQKRTISWKINLCQWGLIGFFFSTKRKTSVYNCHQLSDFLEDYSKQKKVVVARSLKWGHQWIPAENEFDTTDETPDVLSAILPLKIWQTAALVKLLALEQCRLSSEQFMYSARKQTGISRTRITFCGRSAAVSI